ncbi:WXG100 family type VII secretion target [Streptomyces sp. H27-D2]|uniref:WXG100 family type VII secretion target n=1 Tax=Streptomyces sp. H27-D2 TaxID=3046304 RepID=UPI002DBC8ADB|nr:hypothetical protein [Streptomyces sp. H27-D2]MEC4017138.1 hypothetical protein [Streptomyces sp. H27-D2]
MGDAVGGGFRLPEQITVAPLYGETDFESLSHAEMHAMIAQTDPAKASIIGQHLTKAADTIDKIGNDLKTHMSGVAWDGEAGDAFREWGANMANATLRLGDFSRNSGAWLDEASTTLAEVKSRMPDPSTSSKTTLDSFLSHNPAGLLMLPPKHKSGASEPGQGVLAGPTHKDALAAQKQLNGDHAEAVRQMTKLAQSYSMSTTFIQSADRPTFPPMPQTIMPTRSPDTIGRKSEYVQGGHSAGTTANTAQGASGRQLPTLENPAQGQQHRTVDTGSTAAGSRYEQQVSTEVDGVATTPTATAASTGSSPGPTGSGNGSPNGSAAPNGALPAATTAMGSGFAGKATSNRVPSVARTPLAPGRGSAGGRLGARLPADRGNGVFGGRPVPPSSAQGTAQNPRGTVIGGESAQGRPPMGHGSGAGMGGSADNRQAGVGGARRLASETGGVVGGRPQQRPGATGNRPFTPGGSGLVRGTPGAEGESAARGTRGSMGPSAGTHGGSPQRDRRTERPDYLVEDEETWSQNSRRVVPPVID